MNLHDNLDHLIRIDNARQRKAKPPSKWSRKERLASDIIGWLNTEFRP